MDKESPVYSALFDSETAHDSETCHGLQLINTNGESIYYLYSGREYKVIHTDNNPVKAILNGNIDCNIICVQGTLKINHIQDSPIGRFQILIRNARVEFEIDGKRLTKETEEYEILTIPITSTIENL